MTWGEKGRLYEIETSWTTRVFHLSSCHKSFCLIFIAAVFPFSQHLYFPCYVCWVCVLMCQVRKKAEDWTRHLYSGALMESLRLKWQEVKGEWTENSRPLHTTAAAVALPNHSTVMVWGECVFPCAWAGVYVVEGVREEKASEGRFLWADGYGQLFLPEIKFISNLSKNFFGEWKLNITLSFIKHEETMHVTEVLVCDIEWLFDICRYVFQMLTLR